MDDTAKLRQLTAADVTLSLSPEKFGFQTTADLEPLDEVVGQPRAMRAFDVGLGVRHRNYHIYVAGMTGTGRMDIIKRALQERMTEESVPDDWVYVNNFQEPDRPLAISLKAGEGARFKRDMEELIEMLQHALPEAFRQEDFSREKDRLRQQYRRRGQEVFEELDKMARENGMAVQQLPDGQIVFMPLKDDRPMTPDEIQQLSAEEIKDLEGRQQRLIDKAGKVLARQQEIERELTSDVRQVARSFAKRIIEPRVAEIAGRYDNEKLKSWLERLQEHMIDHLERFRESGDSPVPGVPPALAAALGMGPSEERFVEYRVNLLVDNSRSKKAPVIVEDAPNYRNLFGTIERTTDRTGRVATNFTRIKAGGLLRANGGYLVIDLMDALLEPFVWKELKRTLKSGALEIEMYDPFAMFNVSALKPEPIPIKTRLVALGAPLIYHLLYLYDEDFREIFRVKADFDEEMDPGQEAGRVYGRFVRKLSQTEGMLPFDAAGVAELVRAGARLVDHKQKISILFSRVADVIREADYWARNDGSDLVGDRHVRQAVQGRVYRSDLIAEKIRELIADGTILIGLRERDVGQVNGLAVANLGDYAFGRPSRLTASVGVGAAGIINIERESRLSGQVFDKGLLILEGYLRNTYARQQALTLSASIAMEQSYGGVDGDSASVAELLCLLSALAEVPLRQDLAVTGSVNQWGRVQAIGGVNEKIEGFFDVCNQQGLSGSQGVCIPEANVKNAVLRPDVAEAIHQGKFHLWAIGSVDEAIELFSGMPAGSVDDKQSFHGKVYARLDEMAAALKKQGVATAGRGLWTPGMPVQRPDPRPPLPGRESD